MDSAEFQSIIYSAYEASPRSFPWRENTSPWGVLVSEFMLQQTQTERVIPYWNRWMALWPDLKDFAAASMETVLREWSGLGYNRRVRYLKECAGRVMAQYGGIVPDSPEALRSLPGIGAYTAGAIACFAYNYPSVFIETNIRAAALHFFFPDVQDIPDAALYPLLERALDQDNPRRWYWALMDYGAALKKTTRNPSRRSAHYAKQSKFEGSFRQKRGRVMKTLLFQGPGSLEDIARRTGLAEADVYQVMGSLEKDAMAAEQGGVYRIPDA